MRYKEGKRDKECTKSRIWGGANDWIDGKDKR